MPAAGSSCPPSFSFSPLYKASRISQYFAAHDKSIACWKMHNEILLAVAAAASLEIPFRKSEQQS